jgi:NTE family protein
MAAISLDRPGVLVLGGGGTLGEAWLRAVLAGIEAEAGWDLRDCDAFVGTSAGSIVAAVLAAGHRPEAATGIAQEWEVAAAAGARAGSPFPAAVRALTGSAARAAATPFAPLTLAALAPGGAAARAAILRAAPEPRREIPRLRAGLARLGGGGFDGRLRVTAVDRSSGKRVVFGAPGAPQAEIAEAVLASCAVPWVFRPVTIGRRTYVDGGVWSAANLDVAPVSRGSEVLCLNPTASPRLARDPLGAVRRLATATTAAEALALRRRGARVRIVAPDDASVAAIGPDLFDPRRRGAVEAAGYAQGRALAR